MTMIHIATKAISRSAGQSAVASASYRAGVELEDKRYGKTHDYSNKKGVVSADIVLPKEFILKGVKVDRAELWNKTEESENRKDARVAREWLINLPYQLNEEQRRKLALDFAQKLVDRYGVIADVCIHKPVLKKPYDPNDPYNKSRLAKNEVNPDPRNHHAHIMVTTRQAQLDADNNLTFDKIKVPLEWSNKKRFANNLQSTFDEIKEVRQVFADCANAKLLDAGLELMDARSYKEQGLDKLPSIKMGQDATALERKGVRTEKGHINRQIIVTNALIAEQSEIKFRTEQRDARLRGTIKEATGLVDRTKRGIAETIKYTEAINQGASNQTNRIDSTKQRIDSTKQRIEKSERWVASNSTRATRSKQVVAQTSATTPSPFDEQCTTSSNRRKQAVIEINRHQRQLIGRARQVDRRTFNRTGRNANTKRLISDKRFKLAHRIIYYNHPQYKLEGFDSRVDNSKKFDSRQREFITNATTGMNLKPFKDIDFHRFREYTDSIGNQINAGFIKDNKKLLEILADPIADRKRYALITSQFNNFIEDLDKRRKRTNIELQSRMGGRTEVSRMVSETMTAPSYIDALDEYINDSTTPDDCKDLALEHRGKTVNITVVQFDLAIKNLHTIPSNHQKLIVDAFNTSLRSFTNKPTIKLSSEQTERIRSCLVSNNEPVPTRSYSSPSLGH